MSNKVWNNNQIQFARLIAEVHFAGGFTNSLMHELKDSMDLEMSDIDDLIDRALDEFEKNKVKVLSGKLG